MTTYYIASTGSNTSPYDTWAKAATEPDTVTALMGVGDIAYIKNETFTISVDKTYTLGGSVSNPCFLISTSDTTNNPPTSVASGALIDGSGTAGVDITVTGNAFIFGVEFKNGGSSTVAAINICNTDTSYIEVDTCAFTIANTASGSRLNIGYSNIGATASFKAKNSTFTTGNSASQGVVIYGDIESINNTWGVTTTVPTTYFITPSRANAEFFGDDLSAITTTLVGSVSQNTSEFIFTQCKLGSGVAPLATLSGPSEVAVWIFDSSSGDNHYEFGHYDYFGNTTIDTSIYVTSDGATYDGTNKYTWKVTGVNGTYATPYRSPWIPVYHSGTSAITPYIEIVRSGSATPYNDNEVWSEWAVKVTASSTKTTIYDDKKGLVASAAAQTSSSLGAGDWTGENATSWFGKLSPLSSVTPAEIGDLSSRICVAGANTVYADAQIRGRT